MAWLTVDQGDNDPAVLWSYLLAALRRVCPDMAVTARVPVPAAPPVTELLLPRLVNVLAGQTEVTLILDDYHLLTDGRARESIAWLIAHAPPTFRLVLSTRKEPDLALATLRAHGDLLELRVADLTFTVEEADRFLNGRQMLGLTSADVERLVERTGGWPAGVYLASLSLLHTDDRHRFITKFGASHRHVLDFLESEVMSAHEPADQETMVRCSVLEELSGPLCDAVLDRPGSAEALRRLSQSNLFLARLDDPSGWYRFHPLFAQLLRVELERREPGLAVDLHRRAYAWYREHGDTSAAINHAIEAGMQAEAADLTASEWATWVNAGRYDTVLSWIRRLPTELVHQDVRLLLAQAWTQSLSGQLAAATDSVAGAERLLETSAGPLPDGFSSADASLATLKGVFPWGSLREAQQHVLRALELEGPGSPWRAVACWGMGLAQFHGGDLGAADAWFAGVSVLAPAHGHWLVASSAAAFRSLIAGHAGEWGAQARLAEDAITLAREHGIENCAAAPTLALGVSLAARGRRAEAVPILEHGVVLARWRGQARLLVLALRHLAETLALLGELEMSLVAAAEARSVVAACADPEILDKAAAAADLPAREQNRPVHERLTHRELTVLTLLAGDVSESHIGRELFVSHSTVHSHVKSIYRKLGVSSRAEAVGRARVAGLLQDRSTFVAEALLRPPPHRTAIPRISPR
jgi:LuxR family maltose regulon positive regulatory protein